MRTRGEYYGFGNLFLLALTHQLIAVINEAADLFVSQGSIHNDGIPVLFIDILKGSLAVVLSYFSPFDYFSNDFVVYI